MWRYCLCITVGLIVDNCGSSLKGKGNVFLHSDLICTYTLPEYIFDIYVDSLCIISVKLNFEKSPVVTYLLSTDAR